VGVGADCAGVRGSGRFQCSVDPPARRTNKRLVSASTPLPADSGSFNGLDDDELLRLTREQPEAFGAFYERHVGAVLSHLSQEGPGLEEALDLTGERSSRPR
jgi:hypothetical protein